MGGRQADLEQQIVRFLGRNSENLPAPSLAVGGWTVGDILFVIPAFSYVLKKRVLPASSVSSVASRRGRFPGPILLIGHTTSASRNGRLGRLAPGGKSQDDGR